MKKLLTLVPCLVLAACSAESGSGPAEAPGAASPEAEGAVQDQSSAFVTMAPVWKKFTLTWKLSGSLPSGLTDSAFDAQMHAAFDEWTAHSPFVFIRVAANQPADVPILFGPLSPNGAEPPAPSAAWGEPYSSNNEFYAASINFRSTINWSVPNVPGYTNLQAVALHEIGHVLGLLHSDPTDGNCTPPGPCPEGPIMWYWGNGALTLRDDDITAIHAKYPGYLSSGSAARLVTAGGDGSMWFLRTTTLAKGYTVAKWTPTSNGLQNQPGQGAISIGVESNGVAWAVDNTGQTYFTSFLGWIPVGSAQYGQVAAGSDQVWALGKTRDANFESDVYQWSDAAVDFQLVSGFKASSVAVDPRGRAWILRRNRDVYRRDGSTWTKIPTPAPANAAVIKAGANGAIWITAPNSGGTATYVWNQNDGYSDPTLRIEARAQWLQVPGATANTVDVTAARDGRLWAIALNQSAQTIVYASIR